jgi:ADP-ribosylglycohydrolase
VALTAAEALDRALGALYGLAIGDALGMPVQEMPRERAIEILGSPVEFRDAPAGSIASGLPAGSVTDDTMQAVILGELLVRGHGRLDPRALADELLEWERDMGGRGRSDLLGPSTRRALAAIRSGVDPLEAGRGGTTNGAAMRIAPVGIATPLERLRKAVVEAGRVTHDTPVAHAGACVVAAMVSCGVGGVPFEQAVEHAIELAGSFGFIDVFEHPAMRTGVETVESVPTAFAVARTHRDDPWAACAQAASLGGDADTIAAIAGAMVGAHAGAAALPAGAVRDVRDVNGLDLEPLARDLLELRAR